MSEKYAHVKPSMAPIDKMLTPFYQFIKVESSGGIILILSTIVALIWANSSFSEYYELFKNSPITVGYGEFQLSKPAILWINDGLMAIFFFLVGLEIKREVLVGELNSLRQAALPIVAAIGGMVVPAFLFFLVNLGSESANGWGVPMATDIAFSLGVLSMLGNRIPVSLKIFLTAVAIVDDIGAILVIAIFYSSGVSLLYLGIGLGLLVVMIIMNRLGFRSPVPYMIVGLFLWLFFLKSGVHATVAGVLAAMTIPASTRICCGDFIRSVHKSIEDYSFACGKSNITISNKQMLSSLEQIYSDLLKAAPPLKRIEHTLHYYVAFGIMPIFALANSGINFTSGDSALSLFSPVSLGIFAGLFIGKPLGVCLFVLVASWLNIIQIPKVLCFKHLLGAGFLAGIGFTMSIFIASLAWGDASPFIMDAKFSILLTSLCSGVVGFLILRTCPTCD